MFLTWVDSDEEMLVIENSLVFNLRGVGERKCCQVNHL